MGADGEQYHLWSNSAERNQSGTFSGILVPELSRIVPFDPLLFSATHVRRRALGIKKALVYWAFLICFAGGPSRIRTCNPRSRNPLLGSWKRRRSGSRPWIASSFESFGRPRSGDRHRRDQQTARILASKSHPPPVRLLP